MVMSQIIRQRGTGPRALAKLDQYPQIDHVGRAGGDSDTAPSLAIVTALNALISQVWMQRDPTTARENARSRRETRHWSVQRSRAIQDRSCCTNLPSGQRCDPS